MAADVFRKRTTTQSTSDYACNHTIISAMNQGSDSLRHLVANPRYYSNDEKINIAWKLQIKQFYPPSDKVVDIFKSGAMEAVLMFSQVLKKNYHIIETYRKYDL